MEKKDREEREWKHHVEEQRKIDVDAEEKRLREEKVLKEREVAERRDKQEKEDLERVRKAREEATQLPAATKPVDPDADEKRREEIRERERRERGPRPDNTLPEPDKAEPKSKK